MQNDPADWTEGRDPIRAVQDARTLFQGVEAELIDPLEDLDRLATAAEALWDARDGDPNLVLRVAQKIQPRFAEAERNLSRSAEERIKLRVEPQIFLMRAQFRVRGHERDALLTALSVRWFLQDCVDGKHSLHDVVGRGNNLIAEYAVAMLGLFPAALRRIARPVHREGWGYPHGLGRAPALYERYRKIWLDLVRAYVGTDGPTAIYPRTFALANQGLLLICDDPLGQGPRHDEKHLAQLLYELNARHRPMHQRGQATVAKLEAVWAKYHGDLESARRHVEAGASVLTKLSLDRQLQELRDVA